MGCKAERSPRAPALAAAILAVLMQRLLAPWDDVSMAKGSLSNDSLWPQSQTLSCLPQAVSFSREEQGGFLSVQA